jgi:hypothetical protein
MGSSSGTAGGSGGSGVVFPSSATPGGTPPTPLPPIRIEAGQISVLEAIQAAGSVMIARQSDPVERSKDECFLCFCLDCFEVCCGFNLLSPVERQALGLGSSKKTKVAAKKQRTEDDWSYLNSTAVYAKDLPSDYLLRFLASFNSLIPHYYALNGVPGYTNKSEPSFDDRLRLFLLRLNDILA